jgi:hypothetical protein
MTEYQVSRFWLNPSTPTNYWRVEQKVNGLWLPVSRITESREQAYEALYDLLVKPTPARGIGRVKSVFRSLLTTARIWYALIYPTEK